MSRYIFTWTALLTASFTLLLSTQADEVAGWYQLVDIDYRLEVTGYCGLITSEVTRGYKAEKSQLLKQFNISDTEQNLARGEAGKLTILEWQNRGLGGFKGWCRKEATEYATNFAHFTP